MRAALSFVLLCACGTDKPTITAALTAEDYEYNLAQLELVAPLPAGELRKRIHYWVWSVEHGSKHMGGEYDEGRRAIVLDVISTPWCPLLSSLTHELVHAALCAEDLTGCDPKHERADWWHLVQPLVEKMARERCGINSVVQQ